MRRKFVTLFVGIAMLLPNPRVLASEAEWQVAKSAYQSVLANYRTTQHNHGAYKLVLQAYKDVKRAMKHRKEEIAQQFRRDVATATAEYDRRTSTAASQSAMNDAAIARDSAIAAAAARRETALDGLRISRLPAPPPGGNSKKSKQPAKLRQPARTS